MLDLASASAHQPGFSKGFLLKDLISFPRLAKDNARGERG